MRINLELAEYIANKLVHEIHTSERKSYRACRRRWDWIFRQNYYPKMTAKPLEFGVAFHEAMEVFYNPETWFWPNEDRTLAAVAAFNKKCLKQKAKFLDQDNIPYLEDEVNQDYSERVELGKGMIQYYCGQLSPELDRGWSPVKVEIPFMVPIPHPDTKQMMWCRCDTCWEKWEKYVVSEMCCTPPNFCSKCNALVTGWGGLPVVYAGRIDALMQDDRGGLWIVDWKTARNVSERYEFLYLDDQVGSYPWALDKLGIRVEGFIYHEQRKGFPQVPKKNKQRRLGCLFSVNKNQDVDYESYLKAVQTEDAEAYKAGCYDEMLTFLKNEGTVFYMRHQIHKSRDELDEIERNIGLEALEMIDPAIRIYPSPGRFGCNFCAFQQPCLEQNRKGDYVYGLDTLFEKREHYYVRTEPSTESKGGE